MTESHNKPPRATIKDVANLAGVTPGTVSLALNHAPDSLTISPETIRRIQLAAKKLNYRPNQYAARLVKGFDVNPTVTVMTPIPEGFGGLHNQDVLSGILIAAARLGIQVNIRNTVFDPAGTPLVASIGNPALMDGVILHTWLDFPDSLINELLARSTPFVLANHYIDHPSVPCVGGDMFTAGRKMAQYVLDFGHRNIGLILGPAHVCKVKSFLSGIHAAMTQCGLSIPDNMIQFGSYGTLNKPALYQLVESKPRPTAIICINDAVALSAVSALSEIGISVPADMTVTGFGNSSFSALMHPQLTSMDEMGTVIGTEAMNLLHRLMEGNPSQAKIKCDFNIVPRETCSYPRTQI